MFVMSKDVSMMSLTLQKLKIKPKSICPFTIHELGLHVGDKGSREST